MRYRAAAVQFEPRLAEKEQNVAALLGLTEQAARAGARLVVLPEMATTGYVFQNRAEIAPLVEQVPDGPTVRAFVDLASRLGIHVVVSLPEVEPATGAFYNTAVLVGPQGFIGQYRKTHTFINETKWARDGDLGVPVFDTELGRIGLIICMDADYIEPARLAALQGADVICFPNNWLSDGTIWRARALENGVYMVCANRWGEERGVRFCGQSAVLDPRGVALNLLSTGDGLAMAEVDTDLARAARTMALSRRQPAQYQELLLSSYLWHWREAQALPAGRPVAVAAAEAQGAEAMADQVRWADKQARDRGWPKLDLAVFPCQATAPDEAVLAEVARTLDCHLVWAAPDPEGYFAAWLMGPGGMVGSYRQVHTESGFHSGEEGFPVFDLPWGRVGLLVDSDLAVPEAARIVAKQGADLIAVPARWDGQDDRVLWVARALENGTAVAVANAPGGSSICHPTRRKPVAVSAAGAPALARIDTGAEEIRAKELLRMLQPRWYDPLVR